MLDQRRRPRPLRRQCPADRRGIRRLVRRHRPGPRTTTSRPSPCPKPVQVPARLSEPSLDPALVRPLAAVFERGEPAVSDLFTGPAIGRPLIWALAPVRREGRVIRAIGMAFEPSQLQALLARQDLPLGGFVAIVDGDRRIVATTFESDTKLVGATSPSARAAAEAGRAGGVFQGQNLRGEETDLRLRVAAGRPGLVGGGGQPARRAAHLRPAGHRLDAGRRPRAAAWPRRGRLGRLAADHPGDAGRGGGAARRPGGDRAPAGQPARGGLPPLGRADATPACSIAAATPRRCSAGRPSASPPAPT